MLVERLWLNTAVKQQKQEHYMNVQTDLLDNPLTTSPIRTGWELTIEPYPNWQFGFTDDPDRLFGDNSVPSGTRIRSGGLEPLLTLTTPACNIKPSSWQSIVIVIIPWHSSRKPRSLCLAGKSNITVMALTLHVLSDLGNTKMQKRNMSPINTARQNHCKVGVIGVPKDWWDIARHPFIFWILSKDPYPIDIDKLFDERYKETHEIISVAIKECHVSQAAIHMVTIHMFEALLSSTDSQACRLPLSCPSALCWTGSWSCTQSICY